MENTENINIYIFCFGNSLTIILFLVGTDCIVGMNTDNGMCSSIPESVCSKAFEGYREKYIRITQKKLFK